MIISDVPESDTNKSNLVLDDSLNSRPGEDLQNGGKWIDVCNRTLLTFSLSMSATLCLARVHAMG